MPKYRDPETGKIWIADEEGNIIMEDVPGFTSRLPLGQTLLSESVRGALENIVPKIPGKLVEPSGILVGATEASGLKAPSAADVYYQTKGQYLPGTLTVLGGLGGGIPGAAGGTATGMLLQELAPQYFGEPPDNPLLGLVKDVGIDVATSKLGGILSHVFPSMRKHAAEMYVKKNVPPTLLTDPQLQAFKRARGIQPPSLTLGQVNPKMHSLEDIYGREARQEIVRQQQREITSELEAMKPRGPVSAALPQGRILTQEDLINIAKRTAQKESQILSGRVSQAYKQFDPDIAANTKQVKIELSPVASLIAGPGGQTVMIPQFATEDVVGAINLVKSKAFVDTVGEQVDDIINKNLNNAQFMGAGLANPLIRLRTELNKIRNIPTHLDPATDLPYANPMLSFDEMKGIRDALSAEKNRLSSWVADRGARKRLRNSLDALETTVRADMHDTIKSWGSAAYKRFTTAQNLARQQSMRFDKPSAQALLRAGTDERTTHMMLAEKALSDPMRASAFVMRTGDRKQLEDLFMEKALRKAFDNTIKQYDPNAILRYIESNRRVAKIAVPSSKLSNLERFLYRAQVSMGHDTGSDLTSILRRGRGGMQMVAGVGMLLMRNFLPTGALVGTGYVLGDQGMAMLTRKIAQDKRLAHIATGLLSPQRPSFGAQAGAKAIMGALKGAQIFYITPEGDKIPGVVDENGEFAAEPSVLDRMPR